VKVNIKPVGVFDSGVGGLSVWKEIVKILPNENIIYYADSNNCPYGSKKQNEVIDLSKHIVDFLLKFECKLIVVACNTATAAAIEYLRKNYSIPFVGMEPAVKPAALNTKTGTIGILATHGTFQGKLFKETSKKWAEGKKMVIQIGEGLVELVEDGKKNMPQIKFLLKKYLQPMLDNNVDQIVLGCTHYPFLLEEIKEIVAGKASIIDTAPAIAKRTSDLLHEQDLLNNLSDKPKYSFYVNGNSVNLQNLLNSFFIGEAEIIQAKPISLQK
jgi:glutamate racemase